MNSDSDVRRSHGFHESASFLLLLFTSSSKSLLLGFSFPHCFAKARCIHHFFASTRVEQHEPAVFPSSRERSDTDPDQARTTPARRFPTGIFRSSASVSPLCANSRKMTTIEHHVCEWSHIYDESEWSLMTSLIRRFGVPHEQSAGRSLSAHWTTCCSNQQNPGAATFRDGNFGRWDVDQGIPAGWKMHHAYSLSSIAESQAVSEIHTSAHLSRMDPSPHRGVGPDGVRKILSIKASSIVLRLSLPRCRHAVPLKSPATKSTS